MLHIACVSAGHYCPEGTSSTVPCPVGTYRELTLGKSEADCRTCTPGKFCNESALTQPGAAAFLLQDPTSISCLPL